MEIRFSGISLLFLLPVVCVLSSSRNQAQLEDESKYCDFQTSYLFVLLILKRFFFSTLASPSRHYINRIGTPWEVCYEKFSTLLVHMPTSVLVSKIYKMCIMQGLVK